MHRDLHLDYELLTANVQLVIIAVRTGDMVFCFNDKSVAFNSADDRGQNAGFALCKKGR